MSSSRLQVCTRTALFPEGLVRTSFRHKNGLSVVAARGCISPKHGVRACVCACVWKREPRGFVGLREGVGIGGGRCHG